PPPDSPSAGRPLGGQPHPPDPSLRLVPYLTANLFKRPRRLLVAPLGPVKRVAATSSGHRDDRQVNRRPRALQGIALLEVAERGREALLRLTQMPGGVRRM